MRKVLTVCFVAAEMMQKDGKEQSISEILSRKGRSEP